MWPVQCAHVLEQAAGLAGPMLFKQAMDELAQSPLRRAKPALVALICAALSKVNLSPYFSRQILTSSLFYINTYQCTF
jgi:hypothetical protein